MDAIGWGALIAGSALAGWVDAVIGGGGLVLIPLILSVAPGLAPATALGTNKLAAVFGTASAAVTLVRRVRPRFTPFYVVLGALAAGTGAATASLLDDAVLRPVIIVLMLAVGVYVVFKPSFGTEEGEPLGARWRSVVALLAVAVIGFYDGIFGPGTGMFLIMAFTLIFSQSFLRSATMSKVVNTSTNLGALVVFAIGGHVHWQLGLVLAVANIVGAQVGARTVLGGGSRFVRYALLSLVIVMSVHLSWQQIVS
ncbi:TSUP family transporter [Corynebacterium guangdongense]|uniref:Probable membrane transporter protein n=1 Tax=Corynebacterium guangdongense TaxID=1783348 RepID=A0ABU2A0U2_9CORY|nr:TSUP family transporter [Corynebacterium guangdongense]MDR7330715.1 putative membrane protein YfcA [Corynebacterium guangdongense]WJZ16730.1 hypothetical protein CGUA_00605 [Corynebacterium guangdongense]